MRNSIAIPEAETLRRLAAALATSLARSAKFEGRIDVDMSTGVFFRGFPWTGEIVRAGAMPDFAASTAGQYFMAFNWDGKPVVGDADVRIAAIRSPSGAPAPQAIESYFDALFDDGYGAD